MSTRHLHLKAFQCTILVMRMHPCNQHLQQPLMLLVTSSYTGTISPLCCAAGPGPFTDFVFSFPGKSRAPLKACRCHMLSLNPSVFCFGITLFHGMYFFVATVVVSATIIQIKKAKLRLGLMFLDTDSEMVFVFRHTICFLEDRLLIEDKVGKATSPPQKNNSQPNCLHLFSNTLKTYCVPN